MQTIAAALGIESEAEPDPHRAFCRGVELAGRSDAWLLVTGPVYLVGALRGEILPVRPGMGRAPAAL